MELSIQERPKDLRVERGLTSEQLAEQTHLSKSAPGSYEADDFKDTLKSEFVEAFMTKKKKIFFAILTLILFWIIVGATDFIRVHSFEKPLFCIATNIADDGGSGHYVGLGYSFDIEGNFMPEDELPGVTSYSYHILGIPVDSGLRD